MKNPETNMPTSDSSTQTQLENFKVFPEENNCIRTTQGFTAEWKFRGGMMIIERRMG